MMEKSSQLFDSSPRFLHTTLQKFCSGVYLILLSLTSVKLKCLIYKWEEAKGRCWSFTVIFLLKQSNPNTIRLNLLSQLEFSSICCVKFYCTIVQAAVINQFCLNTFSEINKWANINIKKATIKIITN